ncbi:MAG TPA: bifunctional homocysteine S-methyltransferase/methylenetetrahydrofolate reductase [Polyangiaceae bacterium]|jgi:homocysteine S-methyltransferase
MAALLDALREGTLVIDGAMGTQLYERGILYSACFEELCVSRPELVRKIHDDYVRAGAQLVETNTFGANALRLEKHGLQHRVAELNQAGVKLAREAAGPSGRVFVAGAMGPSGYFLGEALDADLRRVEAAFREQADALVAGGVDALVVETMRQSSELRLAIRAARDASGGKVPVIAHVSVDEAGRMADATSAGDIGKKMIDWGADVIGVNCSDGPMNVLAAVEPMLGLGVPVSAVPNAGLPRRVDDRLVYVSTPEYFGIYARRMFKLGVRMVGGCCGTTPEHVKRISAAARMVGNEGATVEEARERDSEVPVAILAGASRPPAVAERSAFGKKLGKKFVVSVEVNPPVGLDLAKQIAAAKMLRDGGVDVINIADGARAQARMGNLAMAARVQRELGMETILHVCGRDRNLLASLAHLLASHELGVRNLVIITGDPPKMGDFPDATPVYDMDSIGLLKLASRLNHGIDPSGKPIGDGTRFVLATGAEPAALNYDRELKRLIEKKDAGAELVMTQPVYDPAQLRRFLNDARPLGLPVLVGILPLASHRNAEFLHNEVPGMQVPEAVRERMRKAGSGPAARKEGVAIAREMLAEVRSEVAGAYVMPPFERYELALEVVDGFV